MASPGSGIPEKGLIPWKLFLRFRRRLNSRWERWG